MKTVWAVPAAEFDELEFPVTARWAVANDGTRWVVDDANPGWELGELFREATHLKAIFVEHVDAQKFVADNARRYPTQSRAGFVNA